MQNLLQHLAAVRTKAWWRQVGLWRGCRQAQWTGNGWHRAKAVIGNVSCQTAMQCLRFLQNGINAVDRASWNADVGQHLQPPVCIMLHKGRGDMRQQLIAIFHPCPVGGIGRIIGKRSAIRHPTEFTEL